MRTELSRIQESVKTLKTQQKTCFERVDDIGNVVGGFDERMAALEARLLKMRDEKPTTARPLNTVDSTKFALDEETLFDMVRTKCETSSEFARKLLKYIQQNPDLMNKENS